jgi:hypothetical protein
LFSSLFLSFFLFIDQLRAPYLSSYESIINLLLSFVDKKLFSLIIK